MQQGLEPGEFELTFSGQVETAGPAQADREPAEFFPQNITQTRERNDGMGGREAVATSNATGPYRLQLWQEIRRGDGEPETGRVWIQLPPDARAGTTYTLHDAARARNGEAYGGVVGAGHGWSINRQLEGWVRIGEIGPHLTASFHIHNSVESESEHRADISGRVNRLPFRPRTEAKFKLTTEDETLEDVSGVIRQDRPDRYTVIVPRRFGFEFDGPPQAGTYRFGTRRGPGVVDLTIDDHRFDEVEGQLELREEDGFFHVTYSATTRGQSRVTLEGTLEHMPLSEH
ncbi:MAG: hypothetical protein JJU05_06520 [Verrucomicrobia bacterium]|nr:hypothetical protein [Verrucomicrobiota bacterium]MCH8525706.1 ParD-like family protein [Kiritimatiellia bacterium]